MMLANGRDDEKTERAKRAQKLDRNDSDAFAHTGPRLGWFMMLNKVDRTELGTCVRHELYAACSFLGKCPSDPERS